MKTDVIAANVKRLRLDRGFTQDELAQKSGATSVAMIEAGHRKRPQYETLKNIAIALGVTVDDLVNEPAQPQRRRRASNQ